MLRRNLVKEKLQRGEVVFGCMVISTDPMVAEVLAASGFDFVMMDFEHGPFNEKSLEQMVRACECGGAVPMARLTVNDAEAMSPFLDTGIMGVQVPHCTTPADAVRLVEATKYAPIGKRGMGAGRSSGYGAIPKEQQMREWNDLMMAIVQVEDEESIASVPQMLQVPGTDIFSIGLSDLSASMGFPGKPNHPDVQREVAKMVGQMRSAGKWVSVSIKVDDAQLVKRYVDMGVQIIKCGDMRLLREKAGEVLAAGRSAIAG